MLSWGQRRKTGSQGRGPEVHPLAGKETATRPGGTGLERGRHICLGSVLQLVSQQPATEDTPGGSHQLLKSDKIPLQLILPAESSRSMHKRLSLLTRLLLLIYLFTPNVHLVCTAMKIGVCKQRKGLSEAERQLGMQSWGWGAPMVARHTDHPSRWGSAFPQGTGQRLVCCSRGSDGIFAREDMGCFTAPTTNHPGWFPTPAWPQKPPCSCTPCTPPLPSTATVPRRMHADSHARLSFPRSLIATLLVFPGFYIAFTVCFL